MTTFTTADRQDAQRDELTEEVLRIGEVLGLKTTSSDYNAFKVMEVIKQLIDASRLASKPMKKRPLTDEKITKIYKEVSEPFGEKRIYEIHDFARAILRKAQEK